MTVGTSSTGGTHAYGEPAYWDQRYRQDPGPFDWYQKYKTLAPLLDLYLRRSHRLLLVGCGNSALGESMVADGYQDVVNIDISSVVIEAMQKKYQDKPQLKYITMDVRDMNAFEDGSFDAIIDKGTLDSLMCGHNVPHNASKMLEEVARVLKDKGIYILITYGHPSYRLHLLRDLHFWNIHMHVIGQVIVTVTILSKSILNMDVSLKRFRLLLAVTDRMEKGSEQKTWELTRPLPLNEDGSSVAAILGANPEVHYIYVCVKEKSLRQNLNEEVEH